MSSTANTVDALFDALDQRGAGELSRAELRAAAVALGWHWPHAPLYAVLDRLCVEAPLARADFGAALHRIMGDPDGPYGEVLLLRPPPVTFSPPGVASAAEDGPTVESLADLLERFAGGEVADDYRRLAASLPTAERPAEPRAMVLIDPQRSFTRGVWMRSGGPGAERDVAPIRLAFERCGQRLRAWYGRLETMFTRCPFPPDSYGWDAAVAAVVAPDQPYFIKPGNDALWPPTNGYAAWLERLLATGPATVVLGGCTLNSCVRVSAVATQRRFGPRGLQVEVELGLCGARLRNYARSPQFGGRSSVAAAVREMVAAGVRVSP